ncbi:MAG TPA: hypothetical protein PKC22_09455 [Rhodocyclaceae bacterium]|nr:hypothetical protein [Rhodocyclaceae bacterium]
MSDLIDYAAIGRFEHTRRELEAAVQARYDTFARAERRIRYANPQPGGVLIATPGLDGAALRDAVEDALEAHQHMVEAANRYNHAAAALGKPGVRID